MNSNGFGIYLMEIIQLKTVTVYFELEMSGFLRMSLCSDVLVLAGL